MNNIIDSKTTNYLDASWTDYFTVETTLQPNKSNAKKTWTDKLQTVDTSKRFSTLVAILSVLFGYAVVANIRDSNGNKGTVIATRSSFNHYFGDGLSQSSKTYNFLFGKIVKF